MLLLKSLVGSRLHGLHTEDSDYDWKSIDVSPLKHLISPFRKLKGKDQVTPEEDQCTYELQHFCKLFAGSNPTILEVLWSNHIETFHPLADELIGGRKNLLDKVKIYHSHRGYAMAQRSLLEKAESRRRNKAAVAFIRVMRQGISLLETGDFDPVASDREYLLEIKNCQGDLPSDVINEINNLEHKMVYAFENCKMNFKPDIPWLEDMLLRIYMELGNEPSRNCT